MIGPTRLTQLRGLRRFFFRRRQSLRRFRVLAHGLGSRPGLCVWRRLAARLRQQIVEIKKTFDSAVERVIKRVQRTAYSELALWRP